MNIQRFVSCIILIACPIWNIESAATLTKPRQLLPPLPGYIPVYIRPGNTPLEDINLDLAEAFNSYAFKQGHIDTPRFLSNVLMSNNGKYENDVSSLSLEDIKLEPSNSHKNDIEDTHIQRILKPSRL